MTGKGLCRIVILGIIFDLSPSGIFTLTEKEFKLMHRIVYRNNFCVLVFGGSNYKFLSLAQVLLLAWKGYRLVPQCLRTAPCVLTGFC